MWMRLTVCHNYSGIIQEYDSTAVYVELPASFLF